MAANQNKPPFHNYSFPLKEGSFINGSDDILDASIDGAQLAALTVAGSNIANSTITGAKSTLTKEYAAIAVTTSGTTVSNVFGSATAPVGGNITGFQVTQGTTSAGTVVLAGTTAGTIATVAVGTTVGVVTGAVFAAATVAAGDSVTITPTSGSTSCVVYFQTAN
ncbi:MAG: hypothetical protein KGJ89_05235 [Patescibacteria group bacterium]|nr:hypothetical protein [Patescibacteria group bacterium]